MTEPRGNTRAHLSRVRLLLRACNIATLTWRVRRPPSKLPVEADIEEFHNHALGAICSVNIQSAFLGTSNNCVDASSYRTRTLR